MISAGVKDLKNRLSHYLSLVKKGDEVLITDRGKVVARIVREGSEEAAIRDALGPLVTRGVVHLPTRELDRKPRKLLKVPAKPVSEMVLEDRR